MNIGFAICGSFCTFSQVFPIMEQLAKSYRVIPILSEASRSINSRFGNGPDFLRRAEAICKEQPLTSIEQVEPIGPKKLLDALIIAPCTGNTLAKLAHGIADGAVTMATKSHLRNGRPVLIAVSTNDALAVAAENIGRLMARRNIYFVPFRQDDPQLKPTSMVADFTKIPETLKDALSGKQIQPIINTTDAIS